MEKLGALCGPVCGETKKNIRVQLICVQYGLENRPLPSDYSIKTESNALSATLDSLGIT